MRAKLLASAAAIALTACTVLASAGPASAQRWHGHRGWGPVGIAAGIVGGAIAAATSPFWGPNYYDTYPGYGYYPGYTYEVAPPMTVAQGGDVGWCQAHYRSYNPATGTYLGFDGLRHPCP